MITEIDLLKLRYHVTARSKDSDNSLELVHSDYDDRGYVVKLREGEVQIVYPFMEETTKKPCFKTDNVEELIAWHYHY
jgi:hypothetical protein